MTAREPIGYHVTCRLTDSRVIAPTNSQRRQVARIILEMSREHRLLTFNVPDTHLHLEHGEDRVTSGRLMRRIEIAVRRRLRLPVGFAKAEHEPIRNQWHLRKAFDYILSQQSRHDLDWDPLHEASNLSDLLGLRVIGAHTANNVRQLLPRVGERDLLELLGVRRLHEAHGPIEQVLPATLAALGRDRLVPRTPLARVAWRAMMEVLQGQLSISAMARLIGVSRHSLFRLRATAPHPKLVRAIRLQLGVRQVIAAAPVGSFGAAAEMKNALFRGASSKNSGL